MITWAVPVKNWVARLAEAHPVALKWGIRNKLRLIFMSIPMLAMMFNCLRFPLAVNKVPNI